MNLLTIKRRLKLYQKIYAFNYNSLAIAHPSWHELEMDNQYLPVSQEYTALKTRQQLQLEEIYGDTQDIWLQIICSEFKLIVKTLDHIIVFIILQNKSLRIDGAKLNYLKQHFTASQIKSSLKSQLQFATLGTFKPEYFKLNEWQEQLRYQILHKLFANKNIAMYKRIKLFFPKNYSELSEMPMQKMVDAFELKELEDLVLNYAKIYLANLFTKIEV